MHKKYDIIHKMKSKNCNFGVFFSGYLAICLTYCI